MNDLVDICNGYDIASKSPDIGILKWKIYDQIMLMKAEQVDPFHKDVRIICMHHKWHKVNIENCWFQETLVNLYYLRKSNIKHLVILSYLLTSYLYSIYLEL